MLTAWSTPSMRDTRSGWFASRARVMAGLVESIGMYAGVCLSCGGLAVLASNAAHANAMVWFPAGFALPIGPLYLYFASDRVLEKRFVRWKRWKEEGLIGVGQYEQLRRDALAWYQARHRFGQFPPIEVSEPTPAPPLTAPRAPGNPHRIPTTDRRDETQSVFTDALPMSGRE